eukprot:6882918-Pyramimonas_sp.AAC.1
MMISTSARIARQEIVRRPIALVSVHDIMVVGTHIHDSTPPMPGLCRHFDRLVPIGDPCQESVKIGQPGRGLRQEQRDRVVAGHPLTSERIGRTTI